MTFTTEDKPSIHDIRRLGAGPILDRMNVPELQELIGLRLKGWKQDGLDDHFREQRHSADNPTESQRRYWFDAMKKVMQEVDTAAPFVPKCLPTEFLDLCCAPGGFSSYILRKNKRARGVGISLSEELGGHALLLENYFKGPRYEFFEQDILEYDLSPPNHPTDPRAPHQVPDTLRGRFTLALIDGHALRTYARALPRPGMENDGESGAPPRMPRGAYRDCLLITQIIIALEALRPGGTVLIRMSHIECFPAAHLLFLFDSLAERLAVVKPVRLHRSRGTCYVVARGVCRAAAADEGGGADARRERRDAYLVGLRRLWCELRFGGELGTGRELVPGDLDFIVTAEEILGGYLGRLVGLGRHVWGTQVDGLCGLFRHKGVLE